MSSGSRIWAKPFHHLQARWLCDEDEDLWLEDSSFKVVVPFLLTEMNIRFSSE